MGQSVRSQADARSTCDANPLDARTLHTRCTNWRDSLYRLHACSHRRLRVAETEDRFDWGAMRPTAHLRIVLRGTLRLHLQDRRVELERGAALSMLLPMRGVRLEATGFPLEFLFVQFAGETSLDWIREMQNEVGILQHIDPRGDATRAARRLIREVEADPVRDAFHWSDRGYALLRAWWTESLMARRQQRRANTGGQVLPPRMEARAETLPAPEASSLFKAPPRNVKEYAARLGYSRSHLSTTLTQAWRETPAAVLRRDRMERARELLRRGRSVGEVAADAGYSGHQAFGRAYRRHFGWLPSEETTRGGAEVSRKRR